MWDNLIPELVRLVENEITNINLLLYSNRFDLIDIQLERAKKRYLHDIGVSNPQNMYFRFGTLDIYGFVDNSNNYTLPRYNHMFENQINITKESDLFKIQRNIYEKRYLLSDEIKNNYTFDLFILRDNKLPNPFSILTCLWMNTLPKGCAPTEW